MLVLAAAEVAGAALIVVAALADGVALVVVVELVLPLLITIKAKSAIPMKTITNTRLELFTGALAFAGAGVAERAAGVVTTLTLLLRAPLSGTAGIEILVVDLRAELFLVAFFATFLADFFATFLAGARFADFFAALFFTADFLALFFALLFFAATLTPLSVYILYEKVTSAPPRKARSAP